jgi:rRNA biogenesis protein RRP5
MQKSIGKGKKKKSQVEAIRRSEQPKSKVHQKVAVKSKNIKVQNAKLPGISNFWSVDGPAQVKANLVELASKKDEKNQKKQRLTGSERYQRYIDEEERIRNVEEEMATPNLDPHTPDQFERALINDRNSSFVWIKYMAFYLETAEIEKARAIAKKAIASINFREEQELLNVWIALLNLEIRFGTDDTYNEALREAIQRNDPFKVYSQTLSILLELDKSEEADKIVEILKKKFKPKPEMWLLVSEAYLKLKNEKLAKEMLPKSLLSLKDKERMLLKRVLNFRHYIIEFLFRSGLHDEIRTDDGKEQSSRFFTDHF